MMHNLRQILAAGSPKPPLSFGRLALWNHWQPALAISPGFHPRNRVFSRGLNSRFLNALPGHGVTPSTTGFGLNAPNPAIVEAQIRSVTDVIPLKGWLHDAKDGRMTSREVRKRRLRLWLSKNHLSWLRFKSFVTLATD